MRQSIECAFNKNDNSIPTPVMVTAAADDADNNKTRHLKFYFLKESINEQCHYFLLALKHCWNKFTFN